MSPRNKVNLATEETQAKFQDKMAAITLKEDERRVELEAGHQGFPYLNVEKFPVSQEALELIPEDDARKLRLVPLLISENEIRLGTTDGQNPKLAPYLKQLSELHPAHYGLYLISNHSLDLVFKAYAGLPKVRQITTGVSISESDLNHYRDVVKDLDSVSKILSRASATEFVTAIIAGALNVNASDIHVEAVEEGVVVRYRIDGVLYVVAQVQKSLWPQIIARLKLLAKLKLNITTVPQDGRYTINLKSDKVDVRVSTIPTAYGESVVMRLLLSSSAGLKFDDLGVRGRAFDDLKREVARPNGLILATGPTGSGKTTTLYAILNQLNKPETKIITLEDPIEYKLKGINQSQVDHSKNYDFARGLKAILRQDPDIVMVGEIRDFETAETAMNAALTGHLVISTVHTNSAAGAVPRLLSMGVKPFLVAPALNCAIGQRLVRRLCPDCKTEAKLETEIQERAIALLKALPQGSQPTGLAQARFYQAKGCAQCGHLGYKGRIGIYEILTTTPEIEKLIFLNQVSEAELRELAVKNGMITMVQDGLLKALEGITSVDEVFRVAE